MLVFMRKSCHTKPLTEGNRESKVRCDCPCGRVLTVTVVEVRGDNVRIGFDAPREVAIHRQEVYEAIQREQARESGQVLRLDPPHLESKETPG